MSQTQTSQNPSATEWCAQVQAKLMAVLDAAWALVERSDDPAAIALAREKAKTCGLMAATARKIVAMVPAPKAKAAARPIEPIAAAQIEAGARNAFAEGMARREQADKPAAAQAVAMRAALQKIRRK